MANRLDLDHRNGFDLSKEDANEPPNGNLRIVFARHRDTCNRVSSIFCLDATQKNGYEHQDRTKSSPTESYESKVARLHPHERIPTGVASIYIHMDTSRSR